MKPTKYKNAEYCQKHDAYYYKEQDVWIEPACSDPSCEFCVGRPVKPSFVDAQLTVVKEKTDDTKA